MTREFLKTRKGPGITFIGLLALAHKEMEGLDLTHLPKPKERPFHSDKPVPPLPEKPLEIPPRRKR